MRTISRLLATLALAACSSGTTIVVRQPAPPPPPPRPRIEPLELTLARPIRGHLLIQTNRPAYVAIFEIVPDRGVALLAPSYAHQRTWMLAGLNWVPVTWRVQSTMYYGPPSSRTVPGRWVYAIASDEPLRLPDDAFRPGYLQRVLGSAVYRSGNPYVTMRAISRAFVPAVVEEAWAEDAYALAATYASDPYRTVRIFCGNRTVYEVPEDLADRAWCPVSGGATNDATVVRSAPSRPDSVVASNGQRVRRRLPESRPVYRVREPSRTPDTPVSDGNRANTNANNNGSTGHINNGNAGGNNGANPNEANKTAKDADRERRGGGNAYGHTDDPNVRGRGIENEKQQRQTPPPRDDKGPNGPKNVPQQNPAPDTRREPRVDPPAHGRPDQLAKPDRRPQIDEKPARQDHQDAKPNDVRPEEKRVEKQEVKQEKAADKQEVKHEKAADRQEEKQPENAAEKQESKPDNGPRSEAKLEKTEPRPEPKAEKPEPKAEKHEAKPEPKGDGNAEPTAEGKPDNKPDAKEAKADKGGLEGPNKKDQKGKP